MGANIKTSKAREKVFCSLTIEQKLTNHIIAETGLARSTVLDHLRDLKKQGIVSESGTKNSPSWMLTPEIVPDLLPEDYLVRCLSFHEAISISEIAEVISRSYSAVRNWVHILCQEGRVVEIPQSRSANGWMRPFQEDKLNPASRIQSILEELPRGRIILALPLAKNVGVPVADVVASLKSDRYCKIPNYKDKETGWIVL